MAEYLGDEVKNSRAINPDVDFSLLSFGDFSHLFGCEFDLIVDAVGVVESRTVAASVAAADVAVKRADVRLVRLVTGQGINGKAYFVLCGDVAAVREAVDAAGKALGDKYIEAVVIPRPEASVLRALVGGVL